MSSTVADTATETRHMKSPFERYLTVWVALCIVAGILLGRAAPGVARTLDGWSIDVNGAPVVSIPIAVCLFFMMYPIMVKIDFAAVLRAGRSHRPVLLTLFLNWAVKPFTMYAIASLFLGGLFLGFIGEAAMRGEFYLHLVALLLLFGAVHDPAGLARVAGIALAASAAWLLFNLLVAVRRYRKFVAALPPATD